jgi:hypothetical protein
MSKAGRGFQDLMGETVISIDTSCINLVHILTNSGKVFDIVADEQHLGISVVELKQHLILKPKTGRLEPIV